MMKITLNLAIFGLNLHLINELKNSISDILGGEYYLNWTHIGDPNLNLLFIYEKFIDLPNIQNIIQAKNIGYLKISRDNNMMTGIHHNTICLPLTCPKELSIWLESKLNFLKSNTADPVIAIQTVKKLSFEQLKPFLSLLNTQQSNEKYAIQVNNETVALLDFANYKFYGNTAFTLYDDSTLNIQRASINCIARFKKLISQDLKQGLWHMYWHNLQANTPTYTAYYHTTFWPYFNQHDTQNRLLKLAAYFSQGANPQEVHAATGIELQQIYQYLWCCQLIQSCHEISPQSAKFHLNHGVKEVEKPAMGFFQRLRKKLGI